MGSLLLKSSRHRDVARNYHPNPNSNSDPLSGTSTFFSDRHSLLPTLSHTYSQSSPSPPAAKEARVRVGGLLLLLLKLPAARTEMWHGIFTHSQLTSMISVEQGGSVLKNHMNDGHTRTHASSERSEPRLACRCHCIRPGRGHVTPPFRCCVHTVGSL